LAREGKRALNKVLKAFNKALDASYGGVKLSDLKDDEEEKENTEQEHGVGDERNSKISIGMSDAERYEVLKDKVIELSAVADNKKIKEVQKKFRVSPEGIELLDYKDRKQVIKDIAFKFGTFKIYENKDAKILFSFSRGNLKHSLTYQRKNYWNYIKMLSCFDSVVNNAIGIEIHNRENYGEDITLKDMYVLFSAFEDGNSIIPVKLEVKRFIDKENTLYVAISLGEIKKDEIITQGNTENGVTKQYAHPSIISISNFFQKINPSDKSFVKYIPDGFLTSEQLEAKKEALKEDILKAEQKQKSKNERNSKIPEKNVVTWDDLTEGYDPFKEAEDNSDIIVHPPAPKKKVEKKETPKAEAKKETKKYKKPLKITKALTEDEARNIVAYIMWYP